jgi:tetratricopeptide (TPR) repeat protein
MLAPALALAAFVYFPGNDGWLGSLGPLGVAAAGRAQLQRDMLPLARDYLFTGGGLASTGMLYSSYVLLTHVFYLPHAHNLYLQIVLEQGLPGLVALLGLLALAVGAALRAQPSPLRWAALAALVTLAVRGCVDADLYTTPTAAALCLPIGLALALPARAKAAGRPRRARTLGLAPAAGLAAIALVIWLQPSAQAAWQADLGAVAQSRAELGVYSWPAWPIQDAVRRSTAIDLNPAVGHYLAALADDPANFTANRRLGQIALSLGRYTAARTYLEAAYRVAPDDRATRQLLGESYAVAGDIAQAAGLWRTIDVSQGQLDARQFWYESIGDTLRAQRVRQAAAASG